MDRSDEVGADTQSGGTRRRFLNISATVGVRGVTGRLESVTETGDGGGPSAGSTLVAAWRGRDPTTSITLQWIEADSQPPYPAAVELSSVGKDVSSTEARTDVAPFCDEDLYRHRAELTDLAAGTRYEIAIRGEDAGVVVETAPSELTGPLTFAEGGDIGTGTEVPRLHGRAADWDPLFGFVGGDIAYANGRNEDKWVTFLETWHRYMRAGDRLIPIVAAIGNHEVQSGMHGRPKEAPFFYTLFDNARRDHAYWVLDVGSYLSLVVLDSNHTTEVPGEQTEWLEEALAARAGRPHLSAGYHVPAYPSVKPIRGRRDRDEIREHWTPLFEEYDVDVVFEHDNHAYKRTHPLRDGQPASEGGVLHVGDGAWGRSPREAKSPAERPYLAYSASKRHVIRVTLHPDGRRSFLAVDPDGSPVDQFDSLSARERKYTDRTRNEGGRGSDPADPASHGERRRER